MRRRLLPGEQCWQGINFLHTRVRTNPAFCCTPELGAVASRSTSRSLLTTAFMSVYCCAGPVRSRQVQGEYDARGQSSMTCVYCLGARSLCIAGGSLTSSACLYLLQSCSAGEAAVDGSARCTTCGKGKCRKILRFLHKRDQVHFVCKIKRYGCVWTRQHC